MPSQPRWQVAPGSRFRWREWDGEHALYHENSGDTHRLNAVGARALECLGERASTVDELARRIGAELSLAPCAEFTATINDLVRHFHDLGLVEPATVDDAR